jgi:hypothetical protein
MTFHTERRPPVIEGHRFVGVVTSADGARLSPHPLVGDLLEVLSTD